MADALQLTRNPGRRPRLSDAETEERMLEAGMRFVASQGLSLSLEHLSMEDLIQAAGVSRTSSYRRWPTKDTFAADLLLTLARAADLSGDIPGLPAALAASSTALLPDLDSGQGRRNAIVEVLRVLLDTDFVAMLRSTDWRSYIALRAAHIGLPDGELRTRVAEALSDTERRFTGARAAAFRMLADGMGYRLRRPEAGAWDQLSLTLGAVATGMLIRGYSDPAAVTGTTEFPAFGSTHKARWSPPTLASAGIFLDAIEPDPAVDWSGDRVALLRSQLESLGGTVAGVVAAAKTTTGADRAARA
ncbi:TetR/AcrR family transcriptional regulator [Cryobacterium sp. AP23]